MTDTTRTGGHRTRPLELETGQQVRMFRSSPVGVESTLVGKAAFDAHVADGWSLTDPAFVPDDDVVALAQDASDGLVPIESTRFTGLAERTKRVTPDEVAWYLQNGWVRTS